MPFTDLSLLSPVAKTVFIVWLAALGGAVGSFLNVVVYRLPAGKSLVWPGSHCPICKHPIRWYDNVPVLAWFILRGRCRDCGARISARYPAIEALTAAVFVALGWRELFDMGQGVGIYAFHLLLVCTLLAAAGIEFDGRRLPVRLMVPALAVGLLAPLTWPHLHPVPISLKLSGWLAPAADVGAGLSAGVLAGIVVGLVAGRGRRIGAVAATVCVGLVLGCHAVVAIAVVVVPGVLIQAAVACRWPAVRAIGPTAWLAAASLAWILAWQLLVDAWPCSFWRL
jgi:leader peptidase (prepilin peptidase)/N-methyltransferase